MVVKVRPLFERTDRSTECTHQAPLAHRCCCCALNCTTTTPAEDLSRVSASHHTTTAKRREHVVRRNHRSPREDWLLQQSSYGYTRHAAKTTLECTTCQQRTTSNTGFLSEAPSTRSPIASNSCGHAAGERPDWPGLPARASP